MKKETLRTRLNLQPALVIITLLAVLFIYFRQNYINGHHSLLNVISLVTTNIF